MSKFKTWLFGTFSGFAIAWMALQFHVVRANDGFFLVPRNHQASVTQTYADVREWSPSDWAEVTR